MPYNPELYIHITRRTFKKPLNILQQEMQTYTGWYYVQMYCMYIVTLHSASTKKNSPNRKLQTFSVQSELCAGHLSSSIISQAEWNDESAMHTNCVPQMTLHSP